MIWTIIRWRGLIIIFSFSNNLYHMLSFGHIWHLLQVWWRSVQLVPWKVILNLSRCYDRTYSISLDKLIYVITFALFLLGTKHTFWVDLYHARYSSLFLCLGHLCMQSEIYIWMIIICVFNLCICWWLHVCHICNSHFWFYLFDTRIAVIARSVRGADNNLQWLGNICGLLWLDLFNLWLTTEYWDHVPLMHCVLFSKFRLVFL